jgi:hypothetical protein
MKLGFQSLESTVVSMSAEEDGNPGYLVHVLLGDELLSCLVPLEVNSG